MKLLLTLLLVLNVPCAIAADPQPFVRGSYQKLVSERADQPFILSFWSLTCTYCLEDLPLFAKLLKKYSLNIVMVATDTPEHHLEITRTLQLNKLERAESWVFADKFTDRLRYEVDKQWHGELPRTYYFSANGQIVALSGKLDMAQTELWIQQQEQIMKARKP